jgi:hypothetical protein
MPEFPGLVIPLAFQFLMELAHDQDKWDKGGGAEDEIDDDDNDETNYGMGLQAIDRLASALGGKIFLAVATPALQQAFVSPDWLQRHAGLMAVGRMAEGCKKFLAPQLKSLVDLIVPFVANQAEQPRVRWAAINALAQMATDFAPKFQTQFHASVLPALLRALEVHNHPRVVAYAALSVVDFSTEVILIILACSVQMHTNTIRIFLFLFFPLHSQSPSLLPVCTRTSAHTGAFGDGGALLGCAAVCADDPAAEQPPQDPREQPDGSCSCVCMCERLLRILQSYKSANKA